MFVVVYLSALDYGHLLPDIADVKNVCMVSDFLPFYFSKCIYYVIVIPRVVRLYVEIIHEL